MKYSIFFVILSLFYITCGNSSSPEATQNETEPKKEKVKKTKSNKNTDQVGFFEITIDGKTFKSTNFQKGYSDMHFMYNGDKSTLTVRFKDEETENALLLILTGTEAFIDNPSSKITNIRPKDQGLPAVTLNYVENGQYAQHSFGSGELNIEECSKGRIAGNFKGTGGGLKDILTGENLVPFEGSFSLTTNIVNEVRN